MSVFLPSILISDAYGSVGDVTFYHRAGKCYHRKRTSGNYSASPSQVAALEVHRRALAAWRTLDSSTQDRWNRYAVEVEPHRPPFDHKAHITGQNLFVSAYHGFATLKDEHLPMPQRFVTFPLFSVQLLDARKKDGNLLIPTRVIVANESEAQRYRLLAKLQLTAPGRGRHPGWMRNILADRNCDSGPVFFIAKDYVSIWGFDLEEFQIHARLLLLDTLTGYRSQAQNYSICLKATE